MESHDEDRVAARVKNFGNETGSYSTRTNFLQRLAMAANIFLTTPGPKMLWQFQEIGYDYPIYRCWGGPDQHPDSVRYEHDCRIDRKPIRWDYLDDPARQELFEVYRKLIHVRLTNEALLNPEEFYIGVPNMNNNDLFKWTFARRDHHGVLAVSNGDVVQRTQNIQFPGNGLYHNVFNVNDSINVTTGEWTFTLQPGEYRLYTRGYRPVVPDIVIPPKVLPDLSVTIDTNVFEMGENINLTLVGERHTQLQIWFNDELLVSTSQGTLNHTIRRPTTIGNNVILARAINQYGTETRRINVTVNRPEIKLTLTPSADTLNPNSNLTVFAEISLADSLQISHNNRAITTRAGTSLNYTLSNLTSGTHTISVRAISQHYPSFTAMRTVIVRQTQATSVMPEILAQIDIVPNPVMHVVYIHSPDILVDRVEVYDIQGRRVMEQNFNANSGSMDMSTLKNGTYILRIFAEEHVVSKRIVKQ
jgi:hypothetical protein